ncbi:Wzt carbohydrate-binding domain-containing protein [Synechococcus sp. WH 5701]|uniref:Wzt carbohydrate-binding domain-containing protein n=1 Tax=Synechococcus sp. WH 5701 TaxID=69042 RepID=UPI001E3B6F0A|nr:Wzt carbohydrate-binding domain-containing protein [Synechococcus sp. WH 5701]
MTYQRLSNATDLEWDQAMEVLASPSTSQEQGTSEQVGRRDSDEVQKELSLLSHDSPVASFSRFWHDPSLHPQSTIIYPGKGACIQDVVIETEEGVEANVLLTGLPFVLRWEYIAKAGLEDLACGCHIASHAGQRIAGQVYPLVDCPAIRIDAGGSWTIRFHFSGSLWPGLYFIGGGIWNDGDETQFIHQVVDFRALRIVQSEKTVSIGACNLQLAHPEFRLGLPLMPAAQQD